MTSGLRNSILRAVEPQLVARLLEGSNRTGLARGQVLQRTGEPLGFVLFPETALLSLGAETMAGETVDVAVLGAEGVFGALEACGSRVSYVRAVAQIPGVVWKTPAPVYREVFEASPGLRRAVHKYAEVLLLEARQFVACNALHTVENRLARALLDAHDRTGGDALPLTQESLAQLLGVQRTTVAAGVSALHRAGLIRSGRGCVELLNLPGLEQASCSCRETLAFARAEIQDADEGVCDA